MDYITLALPKGRLFGPLMELFQKADLFAAEIDEESRRLVFEDEERMSRVILVKPVDVPTYVQYGSADLGVSGKDVLLEEDKAVCELLDLGVGFVRFVVAVPGSSGIDDVRMLGYNCRVATKYPKVATDYFDSLGMQVEIIKLNGSMELAPAVGLADAIVDITETGRTLAENDLKVISTITESTARLIANRVSYRTKHDRIRGIVDCLGKLVDSNLNRS